MAIDIIRPDNQVDAHVNGVSTKIVKTLQYNSSASVVNPATSDNQTNGNQRTIITDEGGIPAEMDNSTNTLQTIEYEHHEIHSGSHYFVCGYSDLSINNVYQITFVTPDTTKWSHFIWKLDTESETLWEIYEGATITTPLDSAVTPLNNNRNSDNTSGNALRSELHANLAAANASVDVSGATLLCAGISGAGKTGGNDNREQEIILQQNTIYVMRATANTAGFIDFLMEWYEHVSKN
jgi:hypothetical protein